MILRTCCKYIVAISSLFSFTFSFYTSTHVLTLLSALSWVGIKQLLRLHSGACPCYIWTHFFFFNFFVFLLKMIYFNWNIITMYYCDVFWHIHQHEPATWKHVSPYPEHNSNLTCYPMLLGSSTAQELGTSFMPWTCIGHLFYIL